MPIVIRDLGFLHLDSAFGESGKQFFLKTHIQRIDSLMPVKEKQRILHGGIHFVHLRDSRFVDGLS